MANLREQTHTFTLHYVYPIDAQGGNATQYSRETEVLHGILSPADEDADDDASDWLTPPTGFTVEEVNVSDVQRDTQLEDHNLGHGVVTVDIKGHTYNKCPINSLAESLRARVHAQRALFTPDLALVSRDDYWQLHIDQITSRLPCVIVQHEGSPSTVSNF